MKQFAIVCGVTSLHALLAKCIASSKVKLLFSSSFSQISTFLVQLQKFLHNKRTIIMFVWRKKMNGCVGEARNDYVTWRIVQKKQLVASEVASLYPSS